MDFKGRQILKANHLKIKCMNVNLEKNQKSLLKAENFAKDSKNLLNILKFAKTLKTVLKFPKFAKNLRF